MPAITAPETAEALLALKDLLAEFHEALHDQEHCWEDAEYPKLERWWDEANRDIWCLHHKVLKRAFDCGGRPQTCTDDEEKAYAAALAGFQRAHRQCQVVYEASEKENDYVTSMIAAKVQKKLESWIADTVAKLKQVRRLKDLYAAEQL